MKFKKNYQNKGKVMKIVLHLQIANFALTNASLTLWIVLVAFRIRVENNSALSDMVFLFSHNLINYTQRNFFHDKISRPTEQTKLNYLDNSTDRQRKTMGKITVKILNESAVWSLTHNLIRSMLWMGQKRNGRGMGCQETLSQKFTKTVVYKRGKN